MQKALKGDRKVGVHEAFELHQRRGEAPRAEDGGVGSEACTTPHSAPNSSSDGYREAGADTVAGHTPDMPGRAASANQALVERIERLKSSISRINALMDELRSGTPSGAFGGPQNGNMPPSPRR